MVEESAISCYKVTARCVDTVSKYTFSVTLLTQANMVLLQSNGVQVTSGELGKSAPQHGQERGPWNQDKVHWAGPCTLKVHLCFCS